VINYLPKLGLILLIFVGLLELVLRSPWNDWYFKNGILLVTRKIRVDSYHTNIPSCSVLERKFKAKWFDFTSPLRFKEVEPGIYAFRASLWSRSLRVSHGVVVFDNENSQVIVKGFFDWSIFWFWLIPPLAWFLGGIYDSERVGLSTLIYLGIFFAITGICSWVDYVKCSAIAEFAAQSWLRTYTPTDRG
jgi:hypothetical protein